MKNVFSTSELVLWAILLAPTAILLIVWNQLPEQMPIHWNAAGEVDGYGSKSMLVMFSGLNLFTYITLLIVPKIDPKKKNFEVFSSSYWKIRFAIVLFLSLIQLLVISNALGMEVNVAKVILLAVLLLFTVLGNYFSTVRPNYFVGIRTPWTLESEIVWKKTHFLAGKLWFWGGLIGILLVLFLDLKMVLPIFLGITFIICFVPIRYSYLVYKRLKHEQANS